MDSNYYHYRDDSSSSKTSQYSTIVAVTHQIEYWIQYEYPIVRDDILNGIVRPIVLFLFGVTIFAIIVKLIKHYWFPPTPYDLHSMAIQLLVQSTSSSTTITTTQPDEHDTSIQQKLKKLKLLSETSNNVVQTTATTIKSKPVKKKKLPSFKQYWIQYKNAIYNKIRLFSKGAGIYSFDYTNSISGANKDDSEYQAIYLLQKAIQLGYIPARITLAAYYVYRTNQLVLAEQLLLPLQQQQYKSSNTTNTSNSIEMIQYSIKDIMYDIQIIRSSSSYSMALSMIQTVLREDEYISIHYAQQYKYIWKQYTILDLPESSTSNNESKTNNRKDNTATTVTVAVTTSSSNNSSSSAGNRTKKMD